MTVTTDVTKNGDTFTGRFTIKNLPTVSLPTVSLPTVSLREVRKPAFAVAGLADLVIEQVKDVPADVQAQVSTAQARLAEVPKAVKTFPTQAKRAAGQATEHATYLYAALAIRGERLVTQIRRQPATEAAIAEGKEAVKKAEAAAIAAKKSVQAGEQAVQDAAAKIG